MSKYSDKIMRGEVPNDEDWPEHLIEAHKIAPGMSPQVFATYKTEQGKNSYQLLADCVPDFQNHDAQLVDLACGDGHLIPYLLTKLGPRGKILALDMSEGELEIAKKDIRDSRVSFCLATAQNLPLERQSTDFIVCHMALMLMLPVEPAISEIARILKPKGRFSAVIGSRSSVGLFAEIQKTSFQFIQSRYPKVREARSGDPRVGTLEGLNELFSENLGFERIDALIDFDIDVITRPEGIWNLMKDMYFIGMFPEARLELKEKLISLGKSSSDSNGNVSFKFPMKIFTVQRS